MKTVEEVKILVLEGISAAFGEFPVVVRVSPEDSTTLWVQVFAVPTEKVKAVRQFVLGMQEGVLAVSDVILLPMVKNLAVTREHYPQYLPRDPLAMIEMVGRLLDRWTERRYAIGTRVPMSVPSGAVGAYRPECVFRAYTTERVVNRRPSDTTVSTNDDLALAA